jgi:hypothetical protein
MAVLIFSSISLLLLSGALSWTSTNSRLTNRHIEYLKNLAIAEAATEKVLSHLHRDFMTQGEPLVASRIESYRTLVPEHSEWSTVQFMDKSGETGKTHVRKLSSSRFEVIDSIYRGLKGMTSDYRIESYVQNGSQTIGIRQDIQLTTIPVFQFAVFYTLDLEIHPENPMSIDGRIHSNGNIFCAPGNYLTFNDHVTASGNLLLKGHPKDPRIRNPGLVRFEKEQDGGVASLTLPIHSEQLKTSPREILEIPPPTESPNSAIGRHRYYNKADIIIKIGKQNLTVTSGRFNNFSTTIPQSQWKSFLQSGLQFRDKRQKQFVLCTDLDVGGLDKWNSTNTILRDVLDRDLSTLFLYDTRPNSADALHAVRLKNGRTLPASGLTVATPNPLYIWGDYNLKSESDQESDATNGKPASIAADAVTILSSAWLDERSALKVSVRRAKDTTIQAALLSGIVPTTHFGSYGGGLENFPRLLENWQDKVFTYRGSMVALFPSMHALSVWKRKDVFRPPVRRWSFNSDYLEADKLPPSTPMIPRLIRNRWTTLSKEDMDREDSPDFTKN